MSAACQLAAAALVLRSESVCQHTQLLLHGLAHAVLQRGGLLRHLCERVLQLFGLRLLRTFLRGHRRAPVRAGGAGTVRKAGADAFQLLLHRVADARMQGGGFLRDAGHGGGHRRLQCIAHRAGAVGHTGLQ